MAAASVPSNLSTPKPVKGLCGARTRAAGGRPCRKTAGWGTDHRGVGRCRLHLGATQSHERAAARELARRAGEEREIQPLDGILKAIAGDAGWAEYCRQEVLALDPDQLVVRHEKLKVEYAPRLIYSDALDETIQDGTIVDRTVESSTVAEVHLWVRLWREARDDLARHCKVALDAGVQERQISLLERHADELAAFLRSFIDGLVKAGALAKDDKRVPKIARECLMALETEPSLAVAA